MTWSSDFFSSLIFQPKRDHKVWLNSSQSIWINKSWLHMIERMWNENASSKSFGMIVWTSSRTKANYIELAISISSFVYFLSKELNYRLIISSDYIIIDPIIKIESFQKCYVRIFQSLESKIATWSKWFDIFSGNCSDENRKSREVS